MTQPASAFDPAHGRTRAGALDLAALAVLPLTEERRGTTLRNTSSVAERLASAAVSLFAERGYDQVTVQDIAERVGVTRRTFFRYFPSKETLMVDIHDETNLRLMALIETVAPGGDVLQAASAAGIAWFQEYDELLQAVGQLVMHSPALEAALLRRTTVWEQHLVDALDHRFEDLGRAAAEIWGMTLMAMIRLTATKANASGQRFSDEANVVFENWVTMMAGGRGPTSTRRS